MIGILFIVLVAALVYLRTHALRARSIQEIRDEHPDDPAALVTALVRVTFAATGLILGMAPSPFCNSLEPSHEDRRPLRRHLHSVTFFGAALGVSLKARGVEACASAMRVVVVVPKAPVPVPHPPGVSM